MGRGKQLAALGDLLRFAFLSHFGQLTKGVADLATVLFFASLIVACLILNTLLVDLKKAA